MPSLHQRAHLVWQFGIIVHGVQSWVRSLMPGSYKKNHSSNLFYGKSIMCPISWVSGTQSISIIPWLYPAKSLWERQYLDSLSGSLVNHLVYIIFCYIFFLNHSFPKFTKIVFHALAFLLFSQILIWDIRYLRLKFKPFVFHFFFLKIVLNLFSVYC